MIEAHPETGLCARPWCDDAALPGFDFCADCEGDVELLQLEEIRKAQKDDLKRQVADAERWAAAMARLYDMDAA